MVRKKLQKLLAGSLAAILCLGTVFPGYTAVKAAADSPVVAAKTDLNRESYEKADTNRETLNFNREWKFFRGAAEGAEASDFDDTTWTDVGLPHNFSVPYNMEANFYVGYGWYRKDFDVPKNWDGKRINIEFEGAFQVAEVFVNGEYVGMHEGGYTGFTFDLTDYIVPGQTNVFAVRVNNMWQADMSPRIGDHQFTGGINRDVSLTVTDPVHVAWYGTFVTTPDLTNPDWDESAKYVDFDSYLSQKQVQANVDGRRSNVKVQTEVTNDSSQPQNVQVQQEVVNKEGIRIASFASESRQLNAGETYNFDATSSQIEGIELWSPENPYVYTVHTTVLRNGEAVDSYESPLGFRWARWSNDGFYLNGKKIDIFGANVHEDHAGWSSAVTNQAARRDVQMIKDCGMNFIRGSHYPHDPAFAKACDELGMLFWSESVWWGVSGTSDDDAEPTYKSTIDWVRSTYPQEEKYEEAFEEHCKQTLREMIRINRNHPSIIIWSMGNETFMSRSEGDDKLAKAKNLTNDLRNIAHQLDPTRKAAMGGVQREDFDKLEICDVAGYNGDGGKVKNTWMPNVVAEYGSQTADRPGEYRPYYLDIQDGSNVNGYKIPETSAGLVLWAGFHHGSVLGSGLAKMGMIDYSRLPLKTWYWYRQQKLGIEPEFSVKGTAASINIEASQSELKNNGTDDAHLIVTMLDKDGKWVSDSREVTLNVVEGPGVFPTGKSITFRENDTMRDGKAAIEFRSYYSGTTTIVATAAGLAPTEIKIRTLDATGDETGEEPEGFLVVPETDNTTKIPEPDLYGDTNIAKNRPIFSSSNAKDKGLASDEDLETSWVADVSGSNQYWIQDFEANYSLYKVKLGFGQQPYPFKLEVAYSIDGPWSKVVEYTKEDVYSRPYEESLDGVQGRFLKVTFTDVSEGEYAFLSEFEAYGLKKYADTDVAYSTESIYLSDMKETSASVGWGDLGKDASCEGNALSVGGKKYEKGLGLHANSELIYELGGKYTRFQAVAGIDDEVSGAGDAIFRVYATVQGQKEQLIYEKNLVSPATDRIDLSVNGVQTLRLVTDTNGPASSDHTDWADAKLLGAIRDISQPGKDVKTTLTSNTMTLKAGEQFDAYVTLTNKTGEMLDGTASLALYDEKNQLVDVVQERFYYLSSGKSVNSTLSMQMPEDISGYHARINVYESGTLKLESRTTYMGSETVVVQSQSDRSGEIMPLSKEEWVKVDGEATGVSKEGTWGMWPDNKAYEGTETFVESDNWQGSSVSYTFTGTQVRVGAKVDGSQVGASVLLDGKLAGTINSRTTVQGYNAYEQVWESDILAYGEHTIKLVPTGKFGLDYFEYNSSGQEGPDVPEEPEPERMIIRDALDKFLTFTESEKVSIYTPGSVLNLAQAASDTYTVYTQSTDTDELNQSGQTLLAALEGLVEKVVNTEELKAVVKFAKLLMEADYTNGSWAKLQVEIENAEEQIMNPVDEKSVRLAKENLQAAIENLVDLTELAKLHNDNKNRVKGEYTDTTWEAFEKALTNANEVLQNPEADKEQVQAAADGLNQAIKELKVNQDPEDPEDPENPGTVNPEELKALKAAVDAGNGFMEQDYTKGSWTVLQTALAAAKKQIEDPTDTAAVQLAGKDLQNAVDGLVNLTELSKLLGENKKLSKGNYTDASWKQFEDALAAAGAVLQKPDATKGEVQDAVSALETARKGLKEKEAPGTPSKPSGTDSPKTGDWTPINVLVLLMVMSGGTAIVLKKRKKGNYR